MSDLNLSAFLKNAAVADLDWLNVDEAEYRAMDKLPKQNLDIQPDLQALWAREGESPSTYLIPNIVPVPNPGIDDPKTMGDMSQAHGRMHAQADEIRKVARLALMQSSDSKKLRDTLVQRFGLDTLRQHRMVLEAALHERGLLGKFYVAAEDFPGCDQSKKASEFVRRYASTAKYVLAKKACEGCAHAQQTYTGGSTCGVFQKEIKVEIPFTENLAQTVEASQRTLGRDVQASLATPKERIRLAFLAPKVATISETYQGHGQMRQAQAMKVTGEQLIEATSLVRKKQAVDQIALDAKPVVAFLHREMVKGLPHDVLARSLKLAFDESVLTRTHKHWGPLFKEAGLYGVIYTKQASFDDCHKGADFLAKHNPSVRAIVAGAKCGSCIYSKGLCMLYGKKLVKSASEVLVSETVEAVLLEHRTAGRLPAWETRTASSWGSTPAQALKAIHTATQKLLVPVAPSRMGFMEGFHGHTGGNNHVTAGLTKRDIVKQASKYMNEGLYGRDLLAALKSSFDARDLKAATPELRTVLAEQGLQGIYYVDPSVYNDYGNGCKEASRLHGSRLVGYLKEGSKCGTCVHQVRTGYCSQINKKLVVEPPYTNKLAQQRAILASGNSMKISEESLMHTEANTLAEYQMQNELAVEVKQASESENVVVQFGTGKVRL
jgi:hypothetical protein